MKITEEKIKAYAEIYQNGSLSRIDWEAEKFWVSRKEGKSEVTCYFSNVKDWFKNLVPIGDDWYEVPAWIKEKTDWYILEEGETKYIWKETEKAMLLANEKGSTMWVPKSVVKKVAKIEEGEKEEQEKEYWEDPLRKRR